jgi:hypothetical protein
MEERQLLEPVLTAYLQENPRKACREECEDKAGCAFGLHDQIWACATLGSPYMLACTEASNESDLFYVSGCVKGRV